MFYIGFKTPPRIDEEGWHHALGGIELGSEADGFASDLGVWSQSDYEAQWREGIARLAAGATSSALVTSYAGPDDAVHFMWPMWREGKDVIFTERLVFGEAISKSNIPDAFYDAVGDRRSISEDGERISEWIVPFSDVLSFLANA